MSHRHRRYSKRELLGSLHVDYVLSVTDLGLAPGTNRWDVLRAFLAVGEARAERLVEEQGGFLVLQSIAGRPNTGGIYAYVERLQAFFWLRFDLKEDTLNGDDFQNALRVYHLLNLVNDGRGEGRRRRRNRRNRLARTRAAKPAAHALAATGASQDQGVPAHLTEFGNRGTTTQLEERSTSHVAGADIPMEASATAAGDPAGNGRAGG